MKRQIAIYFAISLCVSLCAMIVRTYQTDILPSAIDSGACILDYVPSYTVIGKEYDQVIEEGLSNADFILCVQFTGKRQTMYRSTLSVVTVTKVWKGDDALLNHDIAVYERGFFRVRDGKAYFHPGGIENLMQEGKAYILFLKTLQRPRGGLDGLAEYTMDWAFAELGIDLPCLIPLTDNPTVEIVTNEAVMNGEIRLSDVKEADYVCSDINVVDAMLARNENIKNGLTYADTSSS